MTRKRLRSDRGEKTRSVRQSYRTAGMIAQAATDCQESNRPSGPVATRPSAASSMAGFGVRRFIAALFEVCGGLRNPFQSGVETPHSKTAAALVPACRLFLTDP